MDLIIFGGWLGTGIVRGEKQQQNSLSLFPLSVGAAMENLSVAVVGGLQQVVAFLFLALLSSC